MQGMTGLKRRDSLGLASKVWLFVEIVRSGDGKRAWEVAGKGVLWSDQSRVAQFTSRPLDCCGVGLLIY